jgi:hypothetical protein
MKQDLIEELRQRINSLSREAQALADMSHGFPGVQRNAMRILAGAKMIKMNLGLPQHFADTDTNEYS